MTAIFFDCGGVLGVSAIRLTYERLTKEGRDLSKERYRELLIDNRALTESKGTLEFLLKSDFADLRLSSDEIINAFKKIPLYEENWDIARELKKKGYIVGIISDQFAESAEILRRETPLVDVFNPILFSPEVRMNKKSRDIFDKGSRIVGYRRRFMIDDNIGPLKNANISGYTGILFKYPESLKKSLSGYRLL